MPSQISRCLAVRLLAGHSAKTTRPNVLCRQAALEVARAAVVHIQSAEALQLEVSKAQNILGGSAEGRIKNATERAALAAFIAAICPPQHESSQGLAEQTSSFLADFYKYGNHVCNPTINHDCHEHKSEALFGT